MSSCKQRNQVLPTSEKLCIVKLRSGDVIAKKFSQLPTGDILHLPSMAFNLISLGEGAKSFDILEGVSTRTMC